MKIVSFHDLPLRAPLASPSTFSSERQIGEGDNFKIMAGSVNVSICNVLPIYILKSCIKFHGHQITVIMVHIRESFFPRIRNLIMMFTEVLYNVILQFSSLMISWKVDFESFLVNNIFKVIRKGKKAFSLSFSILFGK